MNFPDRVYANPFSVIQYLATAMKEAGTKPEMEIFEPGMIANALMLVEANLATPPLHFDFVLGSRGSLPASPKNLLFLSESVPPGSTWTVAAVGRWQLPMAAMAILMGGHVRVGLEDNLYYRKGEPATNEQLVLHVNLRKRRVCPFAETVMAELKRERVARDRQTWPSASGRSISFAARRPEPESLG